jgi:hypothetical protein
VAGVEGGIKIVNIDRLSLAAALKDFEVIAV